MKGEVKNYLLGVNSIYEALKARPEDFRKIIIAENRTLKNIEQLISLAKERGVPIVYKDSHFLDDLAKNFHPHGTHQGIIAEVLAFRYSSIEEILVKGKKDQAKFFLLLLDEITDPQNLGSIIRTANVAKCQGVIIPKHRAAEVTPAVVRASAGATAHTLIAQVNNLAWTIELLKENGVWIYGATPGGQKILYDCDFKDHTAIILGNEKKGLRELTAKKCDFLVSIPQFGEIPSLNIAVAGAIFIYEVVRQRIKFKV